MFTSDEFKTESTELTTNDFFHGFDDTEPYKTRLYNIFVCIFLFLSTVTLMTLLFITNPYAESSYFLFFNDIHYNPLYLDNGAPLFYCEKQDNISTDYPFGQYGCDSPYDLVESFMTNVKPLAPNPKFIVIGGDLPGHQKNKTMGNITQTLRMILTNITTLYPGTPVLFMLGNNEFIPDYGDFANDIENIQIIAEEMKGILSEGELETFKKGGYYYRDIPDTKFRFIEINANYYHRKHDGNTTEEDPFGQFAFLEEKAIEGNSQGLTIVLLVHIPTGIVAFDKDEEWKLNYRNKLQAIFDKTHIEYVLSAHTHFDLMLPMFNKTDTPYLLTSPAISPTSGSNPAFRVYHYSTSKITNFIQYTANILFNPKEHVEWSYSYDFRSLYKQNDLTQKSIRKMIQSLLDNFDNELKYRKNINTKAFKDAASYHCILNEMTKEGFDNCILKYQKN